MRRSRSAACNRRQPSRVEAAALPGPREPLRVLGYAANGAADELALTMLAHSLDDLPITIEMTKTRMLASELVSLVRDARRVDRLPRRPAAKPAVEDALSRQAAARRVA